MLVILFGPSGVGKTSLIRVLERDKRYHILRTVTTRPPRMEEDDRLSVGDSEYDQMRSGGRIIPTSTVFGHRYALEREHLEDALGDREAVYLVDFALENWQDIDTFSGYKLGILVLPPSRDELVRRLSGRGHGSRAEDSLSQYEFCLQAQANGLPAIVGDKVVINGTLRETAGKIEAIISRHKSNGHHRPESGFLSQDMMAAALNGDRIFERGTWSSDCIHPASYGLRIDSEGAVSSARHEATTGKRDYRIVKASSSAGYFELAPGDSALLYSVEHFKLAPDILAITLPRGLLVAQSLSPGGSYVDPGFTGRFCIPVTNSSGRIVRVPAGIQATRVLFFQLPRPVPRAWSAADATSLRSELESFPSMITITPNQLRSTTSPQLLMRIRAESPGGPETAELIQRMQRYLYGLLGLAITWPAALLIANSGVVHRGLGRIFKDSSSFAGNVLAGLVTALIVGAVAWMSARFGSKRRKSLL